MDIFGLLNGREIVGHNEDTRCVATWNRSNTFQVWVERDGQYTEIEESSFDEKPTLEYVQEKARSFLFDDHDDE